VRGKTTCKVETDVESSLPAVLLSTLLTPEAWSWVLSDMLIEIARTAHRFRKG
jgi:hypothetical protein